MCNILTHYYTNTNYNCVKIFLSDKLYETYIKRLRTSKTIVIFYTKKTPTLRRIFPNQFQLSFFTLVTAFLSVLSPEVKHHLFCASDQWFLYLFH